jgi:hypothetical protein
MRAPALSRDAGSRYFFEYKRPTASTTARCTCGRLREGGKERRTSWTPPTACHHAHYAATSANANAHHLLGLILRFDGALRRCGGNSTVAAHLSQKSQEKHEAAYTRPLSWPKDTQGLNPSLQHHVMNDYTAWQALQHLFSHSASTNACASASFSSLLLPGRGGRLKENVLEEKPASACSWVTCARDIFVPVAASTASHNDDPTASALW